MSCRVLVVIPTFNERQNIGNLIHLILSSDESIEVLVVDDSSPDGTAEEVRSLIDERGRIHLMVRPSKDGLGRAYINAFEYAIREQFDRIISMDGDLSHDPKYLRSIVELLSAYDVVIGSRYIQGGGTRNWNIWRRLLSRCGNIYARSVLRIGIADLSAGYIGYRAEVLRSIPLHRIRSEGYSFLMEMKYWASCLGFRLKETPIIFTERTRGRSKISRAILIEALWVVWKIRMRVPSMARMIRENS